MRIRKCCCCLSLHTGCLIIAILSLIATLGATFGVGDSIIGANQVDEHNNQVAHQSSLIMKFLICIISVIFSILLLYGTAMKNRGMIKAWVILMGCQCVLVFLLVCKLIHEVRINQGELKTVLASILGVVLAEFVLGCYCWLVVWSRYLELADEEKAAANNAPEGAKLNDVNASSNC